MTAAGFGLPAIASQFSTRVVAKAMHVCELLASHVDGFTKVSSRLNHAHYIVAKACLGVPPTTSLGSYVAAFAECRFLTRASTILAQRVVMTRARLALLPRSHPTRVAVRAAQHLPATWWQHARVLMLSISSEFSEIWEFAGSVRLRQPDKARESQTAPSLPQTLRHAPTKAAGGAMVSAAAATHDL